MLPEFKIHFDHYHGQWYWVCEHKIPYTPGKRIGLGETPIEAYEDWRFRIDENK